MTRNESGRNARDWAEAERQDGRGDNAVNFPSLYSPQPPYHGRPGGPYDGLDMLLQVSIPARLDPPAAPTSASHLDGEELGAAASSRSDLAQALSDLDVSLADAMSHDRPTLAELEAISERDR